MAPHSTLANGSGTMHKDSPAANRDLKPCKDPIPIAIIGMACRTPGQVSNPEDLWQMCSQGRSGWSEVPRSRFNHEAFYHPNPGKIGCMIPKGGHFLKNDIACFDNSFFRISDKEASSIDPQQRIMLECAYEAIENASLELHSLAGRDIGVFAAQSFSEYAVQLFRDPETLPAFKATGCADSLMSNRISYAFDLRGPSFTVDSACSSSLTAIHLACQSLRARESSMAIAGGCHLNVTPDDFIAFSMSSLLSDHGKSMAFDSRATGGFGRGEGVGCVILKPLDEAIRDNDKIRAVIRNSGINQDGKTVGITSPSSDAQEALAQAVYQAAGLDPLDTEYVECHGTGTAVGDPIEAAAIGAVFGRPANFKYPLYVGSLKSNIGHLEGASGIVAIIKAALMLEKGFLLPNCDFQKPNPAIPFEKWNMKVPTKQMLWPRRKPRRASVNNFGFGGSNAHFILEQAPKLASFSPADAVIAERALYQQRISEMIIPEGRLGFSRRLIVLSANSEASVKAQARSLGHYLKHRPEALYRAIFSSLALTLQRRSLFQWRVAISATSQAATFEALDEKEVAPLRSTREPRIGFVFTGQGAQWNAMGRELMHTYPVYAESLLYANDILAGHGCNWSLIEELSKNKESSLLGHAYIAQPSCTAVQMALVDLLGSWNIKPIGVVGHSSGEIAAAYASGAITFETGMLLAYHRGTAAAKLRQEYPAVRGAMLAIGGPQADIDSILMTDGSLDIVKACINSPASVTISGDESEIDRLDKAAKDKSLFSRKLQTEVAYHSHHMLLVADHYRDCIGEITPRDTSEVDFHSSLHGRKLASQSSLGTEYWVKNLTSPVLFSDALESLCTLASGPNKHPDLLIEIGPHCALKGPIRDTLNTKFSTSAKPEYLPSLVRFEDSVATMFQTAARLVTKGSRLNLAAINFPTKDPRQPTILTDLETYAWDHSKPHWYESRIAQGHRLRRGARSDILGVPAADFNDLEPRWRNVIRSEDLPWLEQHKVQGSMVYPMSGFVCMAIEAMKFRAESKGLGFDRYLMRDIHASRPLVVPADAAVETMVTLRPYNESATISSDKWDEFRIMSWTADRGWSEHCRGLVAVETNSTRPKKANLETEISDKCTAEVKSSAIYDMLSKMGIAYGPLFMGIDNLTAGPQHATGTFTVPDTAAAMPNNFESTSVIHPVTLDMCFQFIWPTVTGTSPNLKALYVPSSIKSIAISSHEQSPPGATFKVYGHQIPTPMLSKRMAASLFIGQHDQEGSEFAIEVDGLTLTRISDEETWQRSTKLAYKLEWNPDISSMSSEQIQDLSQSLPPNGKVMEEPLILEQASLVFFRKALKQVPQKQVEMQPHHQTFYHWMVNVCELGKESSILLQSLETVLPFTEDICLERALSLPDNRGALTCLMGENIPAILRGEIDPLSLLLKDDLLKEYYSQQDSAIRSYQHACQYADLIANQDAALKVLEIGAGTGGTTYPILETLGGQDGKKPRFLRYDYTDISSGFFHAAEERFKPWSSLLRYRILDIEKEPSEQGFEDEEYDLVIAANVLHATSLLTRTMKNVRKLLKPGGRLILIEETVPALRRFPFATLPGWWLSQEKDRQNGPQFSEPQWDAVLKDSGFTGLDICLQDYPGNPAHTSSIMLSTAQTNHQGGNVGDVIFITGEKPTKFPLAGLESSFQDIATRPPTTCTVREALLLDLEKTICIFLDDSELPILTTTSGTQLELIKRLCQAQGVMWVTAEATLTSNGPDMAMISGLARSLRSENTATKFVVLHYSKDGTNLMNALNRVYRKVFLNNTPSGELDFEYMEHEGMLYVPRVYENDKVENIIAKHGRLPTPELQPFLQPGRPLTLKHDGAGLLSGLYFEDQIPTASPLEKGKIRIEVKAMGVNFKDVVVALGQVEGYLGHDCSGIVTEIGSCVTNVCIGDRVCALGRETFSTTLECDALNAIKIPDEMTFPDGASIPAIFCTAYYSLVTVAYLQRGESVLIHAAAGGVGQAAIMIAQMIGAEIFATVGHETKKEHLATVYGLRRDRIFSSRSPHFGREILATTDQKGVDVVLNSLGGELLRVSLESLARFGRFVEIGRRDIDRNSRLDMATFSKSITFASVDLEMLREEKPTLMQSLLTEVMNLFRCGKIRTVTPITVFSIEALDSAFHGLQSGKIMGKVVIEPLPGQKVKAMPTVSVHPLIRSDATYVIVGTVGGLGRSITKWLAQQGARSIVLLSRTGPASASAKNLIDEYSSTDVNISILQCDVADENQVRRVIESCSQSMSPIRGVVHGAMVLHDMLFEKIGIEEYSAIVRPKVQGAWNLHNALPKGEFDFFVMLSSAAGILGTRGQAVYAGTSTFLGAFAGWRQAQGLPASTIHLGAIGEVGYVAERSDRQAAISFTYGDKMLTEREFLALFRAAIENQHSDPEIYTSLALSSATSGTAQPYWASDAKFAALRRATLTGQDGEHMVADQAPRSLAQLLTSADSLEAAQQAISGRLMAKLCSLLMVQEEDLDPTKAIVTYGLDSLVAVEFRNWIAKEVGARIQLLDVMTSKSWGDLVTFITSRSSLVDPKRYVQLNGGG